MGFITAAVSSAGIMAIGIWLIHNSSKSVADGGEYKANVGTIIAGAVVLLCSGCVNKMLA
jgi:hypothetical protein